MRIQPEQDRPGGIDRRQDARERLLAGLVEDLDTVVVAKPFPRARGDLRMDLDRPDLLEVEEGGVADALAPAGARLEEVAAAVFLHHGLQVEEAQGSHGVDVERIRRPASPGCAMVPAANRPR